MEVRGVAIIGAGRMGLVHARAWFKQTGRARVSIVASRRNVGWPADFGVAQGTDLHAAVTRSDVDIVDVCLPTLLHREVVEDALRARKAVLCEKPIALNVESAESMARVARDVGGTFMVAHVVRFFAAYQRIRQIVESSELGAAETVSTIRLDAGSRDIAWLRDPKQSGGVLFDLLVHDYDLANLLLGAPQSVYARMHNAEEASVVIGYPDGRSAVAEGCTAMPGGYPFTSAIRVHCARGVVEYRNGSKPMDVTVWKPGRKATCIPVEPPDVDPYTKQVEYLLDRLDDHHPICEGSPAQACAAVAVAVAAVSSAESGGAKTI